MRTDLVEIHEEVNAPPARTFLAHISRHASNRSVLHCPAMARFFVVFGIITALIATGCNTSDRIARLEKQNEELQAAFKSQQAVTDYDLQAKCSRDARAWFNENWSADKNTLMLDFTNHFNKHLNRCFVLVEHHRKNLYLPDGSWVNDMALIDVQENSRYGSFRGDHEVKPKPEYHIEDSVNDCSVAAKQCTTLDEFNSLIGAYMNN